MAIEFEGLNEVLDSIESIGDLRGLESAMQKACAIVERAAKQKTPKDTGALRQSIASKVEHENDNIVGIVFTPLEYAPYIEFGTGLFAEDGGRMNVPWNYQDDEGNWHSTSGQKPQPFLRPALDENRELVKRTIKEGLGND